MSFEDSPIEPQLCGDNAASYVLGALTAQEHEAFRVHLGSCAVCREEVAALQVVASALPAAAPQLSAPPALKQRVMASVREDTARATAGMLEDPSARASRRRRVAGRRWLPLAPLRLGPALASAGALAAVVLALVIVLSTGGGSPSNAGTRVIRAQAPAGADVSLRISDGHAQLDISGMPQTPAQRVYEVWVKRSGAAQPTDALFTVTAKGDATVGVPGSVDGVKLVMVTSEPLGGTKVPTTAPVIVARLS
jgi:anti-sigma-K factor RskA